MLKLILLNRPFFSRYHNLFVQGDYLNFNLPSILDPIE